MEHVTWTLDDWSKVMFSNESLGWGRSQGVYSTPRRTRYNQACIVEKARISSESRIELVVIENGILIAERYVNKVIN